MCQKCSLMSYGRPAVCLVRFVLWGGCKVETQFVLLQVQSSSPDLTAGSRNLAPDRRVYFPKINETRVDTIVIKKTVVWFLNFASHVTEESCTNSTLTSP